MSIQLHCGTFSGIQGSFTENFSKEYQERPDPLTEQILILVPSAAIRKSLLTALLKAGQSHLYGIRIQTINALPVEIMQEIPDVTLIHDRLFTPLALLSIARELGIKRFSSFQTCAALFASLRDLYDGAVSPNLFAEFLQEIELDPEMKQLADIEALKILQLLYQRLDSLLSSGGMLPVEFCTVRSVEHVSYWLENRKINKAFLYGFYDSTQSQFDLLEEITRSILRKDGSVHVFFPFETGPNGEVKHPASYAQSFFDRMFSLRTMLNGTFTHANSKSEGAAAGLEQHMFLEIQKSDQSKLKDASVEFFNAAGPYDEAWAIAKRILHLTANEGVCFDQIAVITRTMREMRTVFEQVFKENRIPSTLTRAENLATLPFARFLILLLEARDAKLNDQLLFEFASSPFLPVLPPNLYKTRELLNELFIKNWDDWDRLQPLLSEGTRPEIFDFLPNEDERIEPYREAAGYLLTLKKIILQIPPTASLPEYATTLLQTLRELDIRDARTPSIEPVIALLSKLSEYKALSSMILNIREFSEIFEEYLHRTACPDAPDDKDQSKVIAADVMQLRGISADYVFISGLNQDVFPRQVIEDPFLPDLIRRRLALVTGAGPAPKHPTIPSARLLPLKEDSEEDLLLFSLALRSAQKKLFLSFQRTDREGRKKACSTFFDEALRIVTGKTSHENERVLQIAKHHQSKFQLISDVSPNIQPRRSKAVQLSLLDDPPVIQNDSPAIDPLPTPAECATLPVLFPPELIAQSLYGIEPSAIRYSREFAAMMNSPVIEVASSVDGIIPNSPEFWSLLTDERKLRLSYSTLKDYVLCPFQFFAAKILNLKENQSQSAEPDHDLSALARGKMSESVVKSAIRLMQQEHLSIDEAVNKSVKSLELRYREYLPKLLLDDYLLQFKTGAIRVLKYLDRCGIDLETAETPERGGYPVDVELVSTDSVSIYIYGVPDLIFHHPKPMIGELKWGAKSTGQRLNAMLERGEFQFCFYPELERSRSNLKEPVEFRYLRMNAFKDFGSPDVIRQKIHELGKSEGESVNVIRFFGNEPTVVQSKQVFEELQKHGTHLTAGEFRILKDPSDFYSSCRYCGFKLICRRTHTSTLLRAKGVEDD